MGYPAGLAPEVPIPLRLLLSTWMLLWIGAGPAWGATLTGPARVIDGDSVEVQGESIRLAGIDTPERGQSCVDARGRSYACGSQATAALRSLVGGQPVRCTGSDRDRYGRLIGTCTNAGGTELNRAMVAVGWALAYRRYSTRYVPEEAAARKAERGLWAGHFVPPWDWRKGTRLGEVPDAAASSRPRTPTPPTPPAPPTPSSSDGGCCRVCRKGQACGDGCISKERTCRVGTGCACDG